MTTGTWINYLIKQTVERQRPFSHLAIDSGWSFPSGHSNASTLLFSDYAYNCTCYKSKSDSNHYYNCNKHTLDKHFVLQIIFSCTLSH